MIVDIYNENNDLNITFVNDSGNIETHVHTLRNEELFNWEISDSSTNREKIKHWNGQFIKRVRAKKLNRYRIQEILLGLPNDIKEKIFKYNEPKKFFCDIETEILNEFPDPLKAKAKVVSISLINEKNNVTIFTTKPLDKTQTKKIQDDLVEYFSDFNLDFKLNTLNFETEYEMLYTFFNKYIPKIALLTGWNFIEFDWTYLINRARVLNLKLNDLIDKNIIYSNGKERNLILIDYMELIKQFSQNDTGIKESFSLDAVSEKILGINKIKFKGNLNELYISEFEKFILYNIVDSVLVKLIHEETNMLSILLKLSEIAKIAIKKSYAKVPLIENVLLEDFIKDDKVLIPKYDKDKADYTGIDGGYVKTPVVALHKGLAVFDFSSLYPSIMRQFNISPETYLGFEKDLPPDVVSNNIRTANKTVFKKEEGILYHILTDIYTRRKQEQKKALDLEKEIDTIEKILKEKKRKEK